MIQAATPPSQIHPADGITAPMSDKEPQGLAWAYRQVLDIAYGRHPYSYLIPVALWVFDAILCQLVIWKVPCESPYLVPETPGLFPPTT